MAKQTEVTVKGKKYTLQHPGARWYLGLTDRCKNKHGVLQTEKYTEEILENVVVDPKVSMDDFDDALGEMMELVGKAESFLNT